VRHTREERHPLNPASLQPIENFHGQALPIIAVSLPGTRSRRSPLKICPNLFWRAKIVVHAIIEILRVCGS
jgi:hypothetical protein